MTNLIDIPYEEVCIYDPILTDSEKIVLRKLNLKPLETNQEGHYLYEKSTTIYFLPHCPKQLVNNLLWSNWNNLDFVYIICNSLKSISLRFSKQQLESVKYIQQVSNIVKGKKCLFICEKNLIFPKYYET